MGYHMITRNEFTFISDSKTRGLIIFSSDNQKKVKDALKEIRRDLDQQEAVSENERLLILKEESLQPHQQKVS